PPARPEARLLLACARASLDPEPAHQVRELAGDHLDWAWLLDTARPHGMLPLLHHHLRPIADGAVPAAVRDVLRRRAEADAQRNLRLAGELLRRVGRFAAHGGAARACRRATCSRRVCAARAPRP